MKKFAFIALMFIPFFLFLTSCNKDEVINTNEIAFVATASGSQEIPAVSSKATGSLTGIFNKTTKVLTYSIEYSGLIPTLWHIHNGASGTNGPVVFNLGTAFTSPFKSATIALTSVQESDLMNGNYYLNIHTSENKGGEIRGQILKK